MTLFCNGHCCNTFIGKTTSIFALLRAEHTNDKHAHFHTIFAWAEGPTVLGAQKL